MNWTKTGRSEYTSDTGRWRIERSGRKWFVCLRPPGEDWTLWGDWDYRDGYGNGHGYKPFLTLTDARVMVDEGHHRGCDLSNEEASCSAAANA